jgi:hypothetical protein
MLSDSLSCEPLGCRQPVKSDNASGRPLPAGRRRHRIPVGVVLLLGPFLLFSFLCI